LLLHCATATPCYCCKILLLHIVTATQCYCYNILLVNFMAATQYVSYTVWLLHILTTTQYDSYTVWLLHSVPNTHFPLHQFVYLIINWLGEWNIYELNYCLRLPNILCIVISIKTTLLITPLKFLLHFLVYITIYIELYVHNSFPILISTVFCYAELTCLCHSVLISQCLYVVVLFISWMTDRTCVWMYYCLCAVSFNLF
jgi:hypothetical protein